MTTNEKRTRRVCPELADNENELPGESDSAEVTSDGKYRCRYCGLVFETSKAHDSHRQRVHS